MFPPTTNIVLFSPLGKGGKNRRRGKNENETEKRELVFKEDGQGNNILLNIANVLLLKLFIVISNLG